MKYVLSPGAWKAVEKFLGPHTLLAFDFDGTLAPIVSKPDQAKLAAPISRQLDQLVHKAPVAVVSGRGLSDLRARLPVEPKFLIGNHGLEGLPGSKALLNKSQKVSGRWKAQLSKKLSGLKQQPLLENKVYSLSIHYRGLKNPAQVRHGLLKICQGLSPTPRIILGKAVINLLPIGGANKGLALQKVLKNSGLSKALYIGDDDTDEDVFCLKNPNVLSVRVGRSSTSLAKYYLKEQKEMGKFLAGILKLI